MPALLASKQERLSQLSKVVIVGISLIVSVIISLIVVEWWLKVTGYEYRPYSSIFYHGGTRPGQSEGFFIPDRQEIWIPRPGMVSVPGYWGVDSDGFRLQSRPSESTPPSERVLVLGDSFAYGHGVSDAQAWPALLERSWRAAGQPVQVDNAGVPATSTDQQFARFKRLTRTPVHQRIIWLINHNDMIESTNVCLLAPVGNSYIQLPAWFNVGYWSGQLARYLHPALIDTRLGNLMTTLSVQGSGFYTLGCSRTYETTAEMKEAYYHKLSFVVRQARKYATRNGVNLTFVIAPTQVFFDRSLANEELGDLPFDLITRVLIEQDVDFIDLNYAIATQYDTSLVAFRQDLLHLDVSRIGSVLGTTSETVPLCSELGSQLFLDEWPTFSPPDWHLNVLGNQVVAETVWSHLERNNSN